jgi:hypothetical protein
VSARDPETGAVRYRDDEGTGYLVLVFGAIGIAAGSVIGAAILATAAPPRIDLGKVGLDTLYNALCLAARASACPPSTRPAGAATGLLWFSGLLIVAWTVGGVVTDAWNRAAWALLRPTTVAADNRITLVTAAVALVTPAAIAVLFIVLAPSVLGRVALLTVAGWAASYVRDAVRSRRSGTHLGALARSVRRRPGRRRTSFLAEKTSARPHPPWLARLSAGTTLLACGALGVVVTLYVVGYLAGLTDLLGAGSTLLTYLVMVGAPVVYQPEREDRVRGCRVAVPRVRCLRTRGSAQRFVDRVPDHR